MGTFSRGGCSYSQTRRGSRWITENAFRLVACNCFLNAFRILYQQLLFGRRRFLQRPPVDTYRSRVGQSPRFLPDTPAAFINALANNLRPGPGSRGPRNPPVPQSPALSKAGQALQFSHQSASRGCKLAQAATYPASRPRSRQPARVADGVVRSPWTARVCPGSAILPEPLPAVSTAASPGNRVRIIRRDHLPCSANGRFS